MYLIRTAFSVVSTMMMKCLNPRCGSEFAQDAAGRYAFELVHTGVDQAFVCPVCQHWNKVSSLAINRDAVAPIASAMTTADARMDPRRDC